MKSKLFVSGLFPLLFLVFVQKIKAQDYNVSFRVANEYKVVYQSTAEETAEPATQYLPVTPEVLRGIGDNILRMRSSIIDDLDNFDKNSTKVITIVKEMKVDSSKASIYPKSLSNYKEAIEGFKSLEPIAVSINDTWKKGGEIITMKVKTKSDLKKQNEIIEVSEKKYKKGKAIIELGMNRNKIISDVYNSSLKLSILTEEDVKQLNKNKSDIIFAQNQIIKLTKNKSDLLKQTEKVRSESLQIAGVVAQSLKSSAKILEMYLLAISTNENLNYAIEISQTFFEKAVEEKIINNKSYEDSFREAIKSAYKKDLMTAFDTKKYPFSQITTLPLKIYEIVDDTKVWNELNENTNRARLKVNEQIQLIDKVIVLNQDIIKKSSLTLKPLLLKESKKFVESP